MSPAVIRLVNREVVLLLFRGISAPWVGGAWPTYLSEVQAAISVAAYSEAQDPCSRAVAAAAAAAGGSTRVSIIPAATYAADYAAVAAVDSNDIWAAISADVTELESQNGLRPIDLLIQSLWPTGIPAWVSGNWSELKSALLSYDEDWQVWTDWYEARLYGATFSFPIVSLELARAQVADNVWQQGPKFVNAHIKKLIEQFTPKLDEEIDPPVESIPSQVSEALVFGGSDDAPIGQIDPPGAGLNVSTDQRQGHSDIRDKAEQLESSCGQSNRLAVLKGHAAKLIAAAGETLLDLRLRAFWSQMNSLRRRHEADLRARMQEDPETPPLPEAIAGVLQDLIETLNVFAAHEPKLAALDDLSRDPSERVASDRTVQAARDIADAATRAPRAVQADAASALSEAAAGAVGDSSSAERSREFTTKSARNLVLEALRRAYKGALGEVGFAWNKIRGGAYGLGGTAAASYGAAMFIKANEAAVRTLIDTLGGSPTLQHIVDLIIKILS